MESRRERERKSATFPNKQRLFARMLKPVSASRWNYATAAHLLNRAGFGGTPAEIEKLAALSPEKAVDSVINYDSIADPTPNPEWAKVDPERFQKYQQMRAAPAADK